ncbi:MAG TPA: hypothetical protein VGX27_03315 [Candidatus Dormibacteraeota bacterium]|nr:hypothetical protein [Candidatus Dormibacteraeota bacterium]
MRRSIVTWTFVLLLVLASGSSAPAVVAQGTDALAIGGPTGGFVITPGSVATFTSIGFNACNSLTAGFNAGSYQARFDFPGGCGSTTRPNVSIGPFAAPTAVTVFLTDNHCQVTYFSDGTPVDHVIVSGSNPFLLRFADGGGNCERANATFNVFQGCNFCVTLTIVDAPINATGKSVSAVEGAGANLAVATFTDPDSAATAAGYAATISWGDGTTSSGVITGTTSFAVAGSHIYAEEGNYSISTTITDVDSPSNSATATSTANVADAALTAAPACRASTLGSYNAPTATFTDAAGSLGTAANFTASVDWGDGNTSAGTVSASGAGSYSVAGTHNYASLGQFTIKTTIADDGGSVAVTSCTTIGFSFAPGGGAFVIGSQHDAAGQPVTFWSAQWVNINLSAGTRNSHSFKGFAKSPASPTCGATWSADPGNSTPPPSGPLPEFMGVIVTSSTTQAGSDASGSVAHIVVVKADPGYAPNPGHNGTGTVVAVVC